MEVRIRRVRQQVRSGAGAWAAARDAGAEDDDCDEQLEGRKLADLPVDAKWDSRFHFRFREKCSAFPQENCAAQRVL